KIIPGVLDRYLAYFGYSAQQTGTPVASDRPSNLWQAVPGDRGAHGRFDTQARTTGIELWLATHRPLAVAAFAAVVGAALTLRSPGTMVDLLGVTTQGDRIVDRPLAAIGGKGLFIKELENALREGQADLAVHSLKDVPMELPDGFVLAAISAREDPRDAFVS